MNEDQKTTTSLDSADCLEAVAAFRSFKNLMFWLALICLVGLQTIFWLNYTGCIDTADCPCPEAVRPAAFKAPEQMLTDAPVVALAAAAVSGDTEPLAQSFCGGCNLTGVNLAAAFDVNAIVEAVKNPTCRDMITVIATLNYILFLSVILFALSLLITLKISIAGRLGGINHIARAFVQSLLLVVLIIPWQVCLPHTVVGAIYTPTELLCSQIARCDGPVIDCVFYMGRFVGLWLIVVILLMAAQIRSIRWSRAVIRRLGEPK